MRARVQRRGGAGGAIARAAGVRETHPASHGRPLATVDESEEVKVEEGEAASDEEMASPPRPRAAPAEQAAAACTAAPPRPRRRWTDQ
eukprot:9356226-Alexandrium_andersonii.AAC.1